MSRILNLPSGIKENTGTMKVEIKTIPGKQSAQGIHNWTANKQIDGKKLNKTKNGNAGYIYGPIYSLKTGRLTTGLDVLIENPFTQDEIKGFGEEWQYLAKREKITRQDWLEVKHKRPKGFYTSEPWVKEKHGHAEGLTFMHKFKCNLNDGSTFLDLNNALDELAYYMLATNYKFCAPSYRAYTHGLADGKRFPYATHYIASEEEDEQIKHSYKTKRNKAFAALESDEMTDEVLTQICKSLNWHKVSGKLYNAVSEKIENAEMKSPANDVEKFMDKVALLKDAKGRAELKAQADLQTFLDARIINSIKDTYTWISKGIVIGQRRSEAIEYILDEAKSPEVKEMKKELKAKMLL